MLITVDFGSNMTKLCSKEYLLDFRKKVRAQIERIEFVDENGNRTPVKRKQ